MSKRIEKYPGLYAGAKAAGMSYNLAYMRVKSGMSVADALAKPVHTHAAARAKARNKIIDEALRRAMGYTPPVDRSMPWERPGYIPVRATPRIALKPGYIPVRPSTRITLKPTVIRKRSPNAAEDTSPDHIRKLRAAYCDHFIKTGVLDEGMAEQLRRYANEQASAAADKADKANSEDRIQGHRSRGRDHHSTREGSYASEQRATHQRR